MAPPTPTPTPPPSPRTLFGRLPLPERSYVAEALRTETVGGVLLLVAAVAALIWANTFGSSYEAVSDFHFGPGFLGLDLSVAHWAADGMLAIFFFVAGVELKRELVAGELRDPKKAALPVVAAICGMAVPALVYTLTVVVGGGSLSGWAVPTATDIAFALAVLAVIGASLPSALRAFLLTLAVVDDLFAILIIAVFFTSDLNFLALGGRRRPGRLLPAAPLRGQGLVRVHPPGPDDLGPDVQQRSPRHHRRCRDGSDAALHASGGRGALSGEHIEHLVRPVSAGVAVPLFALFAAGVSMNGEALAGVFTRPETLGVVLGLVLGKTFGIFGGTYLAARFTKAELNKDLAWADVLALASLAGIGFTVSLLIGELAFADDAEMTNEIKAAVLIGSLTAALLACVLLRMRVRQYRALFDAEELDEDGSGVPDIYEQDDPGYHLRMAAIHEEKAAEHRRRAEQAGAAGNRPESPA